MGRNNTQKSTPNRKHSTNTSKIRISDTRAKNTTPKDAKKAHKPKVPCKLGKRLEAKPTNPKALPRTTAIQKIRQKPRPRPRASQPNKPTLHPRNNRQDNTMNPAKLKCTVYKCRRTPNPRNYISIQGKATYFYCDKCWPFIKDYFAHTFLKSPMEV